MPGLLELFKETTSNELSPINLSSLGVKAAEQFLTGNVPLNDSITKMATVHNLNDEQLKRVCEIANIKAFNLTFDKTAKKTFEFPLASWEMILGRTSEPLAKVASPQVSKTTNWRQDRELEKIWSRMPSDEDDGMLKVAHREHDIKSEKALQAMDRAKGIVNDTVTMAKYATSKSIEDLRGSIKQYLMEGQDPGLIIYLADMKGLKPIINEILDELESGFNRNIPRIETRPERVIDPQHPILIQMDTVSKAGRELREKTDRFNLYADKYTYLRKEVRGD